jgi:hypothetical protein
MKSTFTFLQHWKKSFSDFRRGGVPSEEECPGRRDYHVDHRNHVWRSVRLHKRLHIHGRSVAKHKTIVIM